MVDITIITEGISNLFKIGGVSTWLRDLTEGIPDINFSIINFSFIDNDSSIPMNQSQNNLKSFNNILLKDYPLSFNQIEQILKDHEFEETKIYHATSTGCASLCAIHLSKIKEKPFILTEHAIYWKESQETNELESGVEAGKNITNKLRVIAKDAYKEAEIVISPTEFTRNIQISEGANSNKCKVINNGVDPERFKFNYRFPIKRIGFAGRITRIKNIERIINIWKLISSKNPELKFFIIGPIDDLGYYNYLKELTNSLNLDSNVEFVNSYNRENWVQRIDLLLLASNMETQPYVVLESFASGILTVAPNIGGLPETVKDAGFIYDYQIRDEEIADQLLNLISKEDLYKGKVFKGRELAEETYNIKRMLNEYENIYNNFL
ncbi:MAG TPA: GT4 family glycosyltransferase PelF [Caldisericia bacterium]|nr:GT4 family glycosyltransferase PelF [Caldisericia bacterium]